MYRIKVKPSDKEFHYDLYVADIHVSEIQSEDSLAEVEATFQLPAIWFRYYSEYVYDVDLDILQTVMSLSGMELEYEVD